MSQKEKITVVLSGVNAKVHQVLEKSGFYTLLGEKNICPNINVALERARKLAEYSLGYLTVRLRYPKYTTEAGSVV